MSVTAPERGAALGRRRFVAVVATALAVRLLHIAAVGDDILFQVLVGDAALFDAWGARMAAGQWIGDDVYFMAPLYPYVLGVLYRVFGHEVLVARLFQALLGALACGFVAAGTARLSTRRTGVVAGLLLAGYAPAVWLEVLIQKTALATFLTAGAFAATARFGARRRTADAAWIGLALGLLALTRENAGVLLLAVLPWIVLGVRHSGVSESGSGVDDGERADDADTPKPAKLGLRLRWAGVLLLAFAAPLAPVLARNLAVAGAPLTTYNFGVNFWIGNHAGADGLYGSVRPGRGWPEAERVDSRELAEAAAGRELSSVEVSRFWLDSAFDWIRAEPGAWFALFAHKLRLAWHGTEQMDSESFESYRDASPLLELLATLLNFGVLVPLAALGVLFGWRTWRAQAWIPASLVLVTLSVALFFVFARFRFTLVPFLVPLAAVGMSAFADRWNSGNPGRSGKARQPSRRRSLLLAVPLVLGVLAAVNWPLRVQGDPRAQTEVNLGAALLREGRADEAVALLASASVREPGNPAAAFNLGVALRAVGRYAESEAALEGAALLAPSWTAEVEAELGVLHAEAGDPAGALARFDASLERDPLQPDTFYRRGLTLRRLGRDAEAERDYRRAIALRPGHADAHHNLAYLLAARGDYEEAEAQFRTALRLDSDHALAAQELAWLLVRSSGEGVGGERSSAELDEIVALALRAGELQDWATAESWETLSHALEAAGERTGAREAAEHALELALGAGREPYAAELKSRLDSL